MCPVLAESKKYQLSVCAIFRNESKYLKEWIEYHRLVGVDHFYLYNNNSRDNYVANLRPYVDKGIVTLIQWADCIDIENENNTFIWALGTQIPAYENALKRYAIKETNWLVFLDVNEFLVPVHSDKIIDILEQYKQYAGVTFVTDFFDASRAEVFPRKTLVIETLDLIGPEINPEKEVVKTVFKPTQCKYFSWPPYEFIFKNLQISHPLKKGELRINRYMNRSSWSLFFGKTKTRLNIDNRYLSQEETAELLNADYTFEDKEQAIFRFVPELRKRMHFSPN